MNSEKECNLGLLVLGGQGHQNYLINLFHILSEHEGSVVVFSKEEYHSDISARIRETEFDWVQMSDEESFYNYYKKVERYCDSKLDLLMIFPLPGMRSIIHSIPFNPNCKTILMIYNTNLWTMSNLSFTPKLYKYIEPVLRRSLLSRMDAVLVEYSPIRDYLQTKIPTDVHSFTPIVCESSAISYQEFSNSNTVITIPGHIDLKRRDYKFVIDTLEKNFNQYRDQFEIQLLGRPANNGGKQIIHRCDELTDEGWNITYYTEWITVTEFEQKLKHSNIILSPIVKKKHVPPVVERYSVTKATGCFGDAIKYGKPLVLPEHYSVPSEVPGIVQQYQNESELESILREALNSEGLSKKTLNELSEYYSVDNQRTQLYCIFESVLADM